MTPRELHDKLEPSPSGYFSPSEGGAWVIESPSDQSIILSALSLAAAVDESGEEVVKRLTSVIFDRAGDGPSGSQYDPELLEVGVEAAALLVSQADALKRKDAEIAGLRDEVAILNNVRALWRARNPAVARRIYGF